MTVNVYAINDESIKFKATDDTKMRTAKIRYDKNGNAFFRGFNRMKLMLQDCVRTDSAWGDKEAHKMGIVGQLAI